ncbi:hypothetical protein ALC53_03456 [Atta colombica]|uniref:NADH dehydrogenase [ubiquinone] 1 beta subcomplex subunit 5, mitochondrial n=1 Tax=Atta colombica TaxID=520822 RepID=A0A195BPI6_9HYME|nr:hypothetical protein ALC53_03456 [Atta colombica]
MTYMQLEPSKQAFTRIVPRFNDFYALARMTISINRPFDSLYNSNVYKNPQESILRINALTLHRKGLTVNKPTGTHLSKPLQESILRRASRTFTRAGNGQNWAGKTVRVARARNFSRICLTKLLHPIKRFLQRYFFPSPQQEYEKFLHHIYHENQLRKVRLLEQQVNVAMGTHRDYRSSYFQDFYGAKYLHHYKQSLNKYIEK